jgi:hypothetical protein
MTDSQLQKPERYIPETSTSATMGATFNVACFQGQAIREGLSRRFNFYVAEEHGRVIIRPQKEDLRVLIDYFKRLGAMAGEIDFSPEAFALWDSYQRKNRQTINATDQLNEAEHARLSSVPMQILHVAMQFEACRAARSLSQMHREIQKKTLQLAIDHIEETHRAARFLDQIANRATIDSDGQFLLSLIRKEFGGRNSTRLSNGSIYLTRTEITSAFAHDSKRRGSWQIGDIYNRMIPVLEAQGQATLAIKKRRYELYAFRGDDEP